MRYLTKPSKTLQIAHRNRCNLAATSKRFQKQLRIEQLEDRRLLALVAAWSADGTAVDAVGVNNGALINGTTYSAGQVDQAFSFDGVNDRVAVADSASLSLSGSLTIEGWIKASATPTEQKGAILFRGSSARDPYQLTLETGGTLIFEVQSLTARAKMSAPMPLAQFVHVAATLDDASGSMRIYVNSVLMSQMTTSVRPLASLDPLDNPGVGIGNVGGYPASVRNLPFSGLIDELAVYDHALSETEVAAHYNAGKGTLHPTLSVGDSSATEGKSSIRFLDRFVLDASGGLNVPRQLTFGPDGNGDAVRDLYVADIITNSILRYDGASGAFLDVFVDPGEGGLDVPGDLVFDSDSNLLVTGTSSNQVHKYDSSGAFMGIVASGLNAPYGIEIASDGSLLIANSGTDEILKVTGSTVTTFISSGSGGLDEPRNVVIGPDGDLYVVSRITGSILRYDGITLAPKGSFASNPSGGSMMWAEFGADGHMYASYRTNTTSLNVTLARFNGTTGELEDSLDNGRDSWSFIVGADNVIFNAGNGGGNYVDRFVVTQDASFTISLNAPFPDPVQVDFSTTDASAFSGTDYFSLVGTVTFLPGQFSKTIFVPVVDDEQIEGTETFRVTLSNSLGATILDGVGVATIVDNEAPPTLFYDSFEVGEWNGLWVEDSQNDWFRSTQRATDGSWSAEVDGSATNATLTTANAIDLSGVAESTLTFDWLIESGFDAGEYLALDISTNGGASWAQDVRRLNGNVSQEDVWHSETVDLTPYASANLKVRFRSKVSGSDEDADVDNVRIVGISLGPNTPPVANAGGPYSLNEGSSIVLSGAGSSDPDGTIASYAWDFDGDGQYDDAAGVAPSFAQTNSGNYFVGLQVTDNRGATSTATASVNVNNVAPTANAGSDQNGSVGAPVSLSASGSSDPGNDIVGYAWDLDNDGQYDDASGVSASFIAAAAGTYTIGLKVTDADGAVSTDSTTITITQTLSTKFYVLNDATTNRTYEYDAMGGAIENYAINSGNSAPRGAASTAAGTTVWVADKNRKVFLYDTAGGLQGSWTAGTLNSKSQVEGLATNGSDVWIVDNRNNAVYRYTGAASRTSGSQNAASSFSLNSSNTNPKGIVTDGTYLWVVNDSSIDKVFKYSLSGTLVGSWTIDSANQLPTGLTIDPTNGSQSIWIVDSGTDKVYEYASARGTTSGSLSATVTFPLASGNSNPQGIADPPAPGSRLDAARLPAVQSVSGMTPPLDSNRPIPVTDVRRSDEQPKALNRSDESDQLLNRFTATSLETTRNPLTPPSGSHQLPMAGNIDETDDVFSLDDPFGPLDESLLGLLAHQR